MGAFSLVSKAGLRLGIEHPRDFGAFNTFPRSVWAHTHPLLLPQPRPRGPGHLTTLSVFSCPFTHPSFLPTYLLTFRPTQFCDLPPYFLRLRHSPPPRVPLFFPRSPSPSMSVVPARPFFYFIFSQIVPPRSVARQDLHIAENLTVFLLFYPFFISGSVSRFSNLSRCPPSSSNQSLCQWAVIPSVRFLQVSEVSGS